jgi:iron complex transport system substrate-binding protein
MLLVGCLTGCGDDSSSASDETGTAGASGEGATNYPLTLENCGTEVTYEQAPERAVTLNQSAAEILIHLGVGDQVVGTGYETDRVPDEIAEEYEAIPLLSGSGEFVPQEGLLAAQPDFVYSSFASFFSAAESGERAELHELDIPTYLTEFDCSLHEAVAGASFELLFQEYEDLGAIFDVPSAAEDLVAEQQAVLDDGLATAEDIEGIEGTPSLMWFYSSYEGTPYAAGPGGLPQHVTELLGAENIFDDASTKWPEVSWDEVAARNPDVIILADLTRGEPGDTAEEKIEILQEDPLTDAVRNERFIVVPGRYMDPSFGSVNAVTAVAEGLAELEQTPS